MTNLNSIIILKKLFLRVILKKTKFDASYPCFQQLKILPLRSLFLYKTLKLFYYSSRCNRMESNYRLRSRNANYYFVPKPNVTFYTRTYYFIAPRVYNKLPNNIKTLANGKQFLKKVREWLMSFKNVEFLIDIIS